MRSVVLLAAHAVKNTRRQYIARLIFLVYPAKDLAEIGKYRTGELVYKERAIGT